MASNNTIINSKGSSSADKENATNSNTELNTQNTQLYSDLKDLKKLQ